jgi:hypothetical protein
MKSELMMRAAHIGKVAAAFGIAALMNKLFWGREDGDELVPIGGIKTGSKDGKTTHFDLAGLTGYSRGLRAVGLKAYLEDQRKPKTERNTAGAIHKGVDDAKHSIMHPFLGPPVAAAYMGATGKNTMGYQVAETVSKATTDAGKDRAEASGKKADKPFEQEMLNLTAMLYNLNPTVAVLTGRDKPPPPKGEKREINYGKILGPFNPLQEREAKKKK